MSKKLPPKETLRLCDRFEKLRRRLYARVPETSKRKGDPFGGENEAIQQRLKFLREAEGKSFARIWEIREEDERKEEKLRKEKEMLPRRGTPNTQARTKRPNHVKDKPSRLPNPNCSCC